MSDIFDANDPIEEAYRLEVSSPGIDRPLTRLNDFADWKGHEARIRFTEPVDGAKQVSGIIDGIDGDTVRVSDDHGRTQRRLFHRFGQARPDRTN